MGIYTGIQTYQRWGCVHPCSSRPPDVSQRHTRPGKHTKSYWTWSIEIVVLPIKKNMIFHSYVSLLEGILGLTCFSELFEVGHAWGFCPLLHVLYPSRLYITRAMSDTIISVHDWGLCAKSHSQNSDQFSCFFLRKSKHPRIWIFCIDLNDPRSRVYVVPIENQNIQGSS